MAKVMAKCSSINQQKNELFDLQNNYYIFIQQLNVTNEI